MIVGVRNFTLLYYMVCSFYTHDVCIFASVHVGKVVIRAL